MKRIKRWLLIKILGLKNIEHILHSLRCGFDMKALEIGFVHQDEVTAGQTLADIVGGRSADAYTYCVTDPTSLIFQRMTNNKGYINT
jgi:hypothetical protein